MRSSAKDNNSLSYFFVTVLYRGNSILLRRITVTLLYLYSVVASYNLFIYEEGRLIHNDAVIIKLDYLKNALRVWIITKYYIAILVPHFVFDDFKNVHKNLYRSIDRSSFVRSRGDGDDDDYDDKRHSIEYGGVVCGVVHRMYCTYILFRLEEDVDDTFCSRTTKYISGGCASEKLN